MLIKGQLKLSQIFDEILQKKIKSDKIKSGLIVPLDLISSLGLCAQRVLYRVPGGSVPVF